MEDVLYPEALAPATYFRNPQEPSTFSQQKDTQIILIVQQDQYYEWEHHRPSEVLSTELHGMPSWWHSEQYKGQLVVSSVGLGRSRINSTLGLKLTE